MKNKTSAQVKEAFLLALALDNPNNIVPADETGMVTDAFIQQVVALLNQPSVSPAVSKAGSIGGCAGGSAAIAISVTAPGNVTWQAYASSTTLYSTGGGSGTGSGLFKINIAVPAESPTPGFTCDDLADFDYSEYYRVDFYGSDGSLVDSEQVEVDWVYLMVL